jgi:DNA polymerase II small subunit
MKKNLVEVFLNKGFLLSPDVLESINEFDEEFLNLFLNKINSKEKLVVLNKDLFSIVKSSKNFLKINWVEFEKSRALLEKGKNGKVYSTFVSLMSGSSNIKESLDINEENFNDEESGLVYSEDGKGFNVIVLNSYNLDPKKWEIKDFVDHYRNKYNSLKDIIQKRLDFSNVLSINKLRNKTTKDKASIIGLVSDKTITSNDNVMVTLEDLTGEIKVLVNKDKLELYSIARNLVFDEVVGVSGVVGNNIVFANNIVFPDIPLNKEFKKTRDEVYAAFISDLHVGSKLFLKKDFQKFIDWVNCKSGNSQQKEIAKKLGYIFVLGDICDGVGIYPKQDSELEIKDIKKQYDEVAEYLSQIRQDIKIIMCPGNHDALRLSEPQPPLNKNSAESLYKLKNIIFVSNPAFVNIHSSVDFPGFDVLMYHGASFHYYIDNVDNLRLNNARDNPSLVLKFLLQKRHLAPSHGSSLYVPYSKDDPLVIKKIPDFFVAGEMHRCDVIQNFNNITLINCSCWQSKTDYQEKTGNNPDPSRVPVVNLKTRDVKILNFRN